MSSVNNFPLHSSYISSFHPTEHILSRGQCVNTCDSTETSRAHGVISREWMPQTCDNTDIVRSAPLFRKPAILAWLANVHNAFFISYMTCFHYIYSELTQLLLSCSKNLTLKMWGSVISYHHQNIYIAPFTDKIRNRYCVLAIPTENKRSSPSRTDIAILISISKSMTMLNWCMDVLLSSTLQNFRATCMVRYRQEEVSPRFSAQ